MNLTALAEKFSSSHTTNIEAFYAQAIGVIDCIERLTALNIHITRSLLEDGAISARDMLSGDTEKGVLDQHYQRVKPRMERTVAYARGLLEISLAGQQGLSETAQCWFANQNHIFRTAIEDALQAAPVGSDAVLAAVSSAATVSKELFERVSQAGAESMAGANAVTAEEVEVKTKASAKAATSRKAKTVSEDDA